MFTKKKLMIVDDDTLSIYLNKITIEQTNMASICETFDNGLDAINFIKKNTNNPNSLPDIILLDLFMPIMDGWQFINEYNSFKEKLSKEIQIFIVSSSISPDDISRSKSYNSIKDYIIKPITKEKIINTINNF